MSSYRQILYHLIFRTKYSEKTIVPEHSHELYKHITGILKNKKCFVYQINGIEDHIHILCDLHPSVALADLMRDIKVSSSLFLKASNKFPSFKGWSGGYAAITHSYSKKLMLINYIKNQQQHHKKESPEEELRRELLDNGIDIDERYFP